MNSDLWRRLRIGDRVRIVQFPPEFADKTRLHKETRELYEWLVETKSILTIHRIDSLGLPYGEIWTQNEKEWQSIALNHGGLEIVE